MYIFSMKFSLVFLVFFVIGTVMSMPYGEDEESEIGDSSPTVDENTLAMEVSTKGGEDGASTEEKEIAKPNFDHKNQNQGRNCHHSTFYPGKSRNPCGLDTYKWSCGSSGPCAYNGAVGYFQVINNPYYFIQCGSGGISYCQPCAPGTVWSQHAYSCVHGY